MNKIIIYTDGSCLKNPGPGGWAFVVVEDNQITEEYFGSYVDTTNNKMELQAVLSALEWIMKTHGTRSTAQVITDSKYVQQGITAWIKNWKKNHWKTSQGDPVKNQDYWSRLSELNDQLCIDWQWVKAHHVNPFNIHVDNLARQAAVQQRGSYV